MREMGQSAWLSTSLHNLQGLKGRSQCNGDRSCHLWFAYSGKILCACRNFMVLDLLNNRNTPSRTLKKTRLLTHLTQTPTSPASLRLPRQSLRPRTRLLQAGPQRAMTYYCTKGWLGCPQLRVILARPPTGTPRRAIYPGEGLPNFLCLSWKGRPRLPYTPRIKRARF